MNNRYELYITREAKEVKDRQADNGFSGTFATLYEAMLALRHDDGYILDTKTGRKWRHKRREAACSMQS